MIFKNERQYRYNYGRKVTRGKKMSFVLIHARFSERIFEPDHLAEKKGREALKKRSK
jgi:hypothetical protein